MKINWKPLKISEFILGECGDLHKTKDIVFDLTVQNFSFFRTNY